MYHPLFLRVTQNKDRRVTSTVYLATLTVRLTIGESSWSWQLYFNMNIKFKTNLHLLTNPKDHFWHPSPKYNINVLHSKRRASIILPEDEAILFWTFASLKCATPLAELFHSQISFPRRPARTGSVCRSILSLFFQLSTFFTFNFFRFVSFLRLWLLWSLAWLVTSIWLNLEKY